MKFILATVLALFVVIAPAAATGVIAHRAGGQPCGASSILPEDHPLPDTTMSSVRAAFQAGADWVEVDLSVNGNGQLVVLYGRADCQNLPPPPSLRALLTAFPEGRFFLNMTGGPRGAADTMIDYLKAAKAGGLVRPGQVKVYSHDALINGQMAGALPELAAPGMVMQQAAGCLATYAERGVFPRDCYGADIPLPIGALRNMGGYVEDFITAVHAVGGRAHVLDVNTAADYEFSAAFAPDFIWTERMEALGL